MKWMTVDHDYRCDRVVSIESTVLHPLLFSVFYLRFFRP